MAGGGVGGRTLARSTLVELMLAAAKKPPPALREYLGGTLVGELDMAAVPRDPNPVILMIFRQLIVRVLESALIERGHCVEWSIA